MAGINDPFTFIKAETYFDRAKHWSGPTSVISVDTTPPTSAKEPNYWHGVNIKLNDNTFAVVQYIRPTLFRVRYDPRVKEANQYEDASSHVIIGQYTSALVKDLDEYRGLVWGTTLTRHESGKHWTFESKVTEVKKGGGSHYKEGDGMKVHIWENPFRIQAVRHTTPHGDLYPVPDVPPPDQRKATKVVWQTSPRTFLYELDSQHQAINNVVVDVIKAGQGEFIGFGEQGGMAFMKKPLFMNYFNYDNMQYQQVYDKGPLDAREPLYHSDPFYLDVNSNPEHKNVTATFLDNYSQIAVDFGMTNSGYIKLGTRFGQMDLYLISADTVPDIVRLYTGIVGRPKLKPRYVLGNHQACYGYEKEADLLAVQKQYRDAGIPFDGLHIDVDFQDNFRTFTTNPRTFPNANKILHDLKADGIKCSTNITPVISLRDLDGPVGYPTLRSGLEHGHFILDKRYTVGTSGRAEDVRYAFYAAGNMVEINPNDKSPWNRPDYGDDYDFPANFNSNYPYHGAVSYGYKNGTPGYYPDLNRPEVRVWWGQQYQHLFDTGLEFVWQDMTTPAIHTAYGDMKGLPNRLLVNADPVSDTPPKLQLAIENWALYSYNLHKATARGLDVLPGRENKRNFILGRGSFSGMYRYAGLWTGDNASTWNFWKITISQVLSVGLNGVSIAGMDTGGFEPGKDANNQEEKYCSPELLIRWYAGSYLLPWLRNHYVKKDRKWFQEPYAYTKHWYEHQELDKDLYLAVERICKYYIELRYSLLQVLYDAMFENQLTGLPIARSMLLTDVQDASFFNETQHFLDDQYMCRDDILVAPIMRPGNEVPGQNRDVYLPVEYDWYPSNLRPWDDQSVPILSPVEGGSIINYTARISNDYAQFPYVTPTFIREGSIIPQLKVTKYVGDISNGPNRLKWNIYPGKDRDYTTYLDDGVSRSSAPTDSVRYRIVQKVKGLRAKKIKSGQALHDEGDEEAKGEYREVKLSQTTVSGVRTLTVAKKHDMFDPSPHVGTLYTLIFWYNEGVNVTNYKVEVTGLNTGVTYEVFKRNDLRTVTLDIKEALGTSELVTVKVTPA